MSYLLKIINLLITTKSVETQNFDLKHGVQVFHDFIFFSNSTTNSEVFSPIFFLEMKTNKYF